MATATKKATKKETKWAPIVQAVIDGEHDVYLADIIRAAEWRKKKILFDAGIHKGTRVHLVEDPRNGPYGGREGIVQKINKVRATVDLECSACHSAVAVPDGTEWTRRCKECSGIPETLGIPLDLMTAVT